MPTKQQVEGLIERLAPLRNISCIDHALMLTGEGWYKDCPDCTQARNDIVIGTVLEKINEKGGPARDVNWLALLHLWETLGLSRSLQDIVSDNGYEKIRVESELQPIRDGESWIPCSIHSAEFLTSEASALFEFLLHLFPEKNEYKN